MYVPFVRKKQTPQCTAHENQLLRTTDDGQWTMDDGRRRMDDGQLTMDDRQWTMDD